MRLTFNFTIDFKRTPKPVPVERESDTYTDIERADDFKPYFQPVEGPENRTKPTKTRPQP